MTHIATEALTHYPVTCGFIEFIAQSANAVYKVEDPEGRRYTLQLHWSVSDSLEDCWTAPDAIRSEMVWLEALSREPGLTVPVPVRNNRGEFVTIVEGTACTLLTWVEGEQRPAITTAEESRLSAA